MKKLFFFILLGLIALQPLISVAAPLTAEQKAVLELQQKIIQLREVAAKSQNDAQTREGDTDTLNPLAPPTTQNAAPTNTDLAPPAPDTNANTGTADATQPLSVREQAFAGVVNQLLPMRPDEIVNLRKSYDAAQQASATLPNTPPQPTSSSIQVDLQPKATPPVIRLQAGYISSLVFMDATGQPWPIAAYSLGDPGAFNVQWDKKGNTLLIQSNTYYKSTNLAVILRGLNTPVMLTLIPGQAAVDYRVDLRIPGLGPNAIFSQSSSADSATNPLLLDVLNGVAPPDSKRLIVSGSNECQAWVKGKKLYVRTNLDIISPAWRSIISSIDGTHAYELQPTPVILALEHGKDKTITLKLEGWE